MNKAKLLLPGMDDFFTVEAYKILRTNIQFSGQDIKIIGVTSCKENDGKTTVSLHLARCFAELGKKVIYLDNDLRKSAVAGRNADMPKKSPGVAEVLTGQARLDDCIFNTQYENCDLLIAGKFPPNPVELLESKYYDDLLAELSKRYDYIIVDTPPLGQVIDMAVIAPKFDGCILILGDAKTDARLAKDVITQIKKTQCRILGIVRNNKGGGSRRYGYYKSYGYGKKYGKYGYGYGYG